MNTLFKDFTDSGTGIVTFKKGKIYYESLRGKEILIMGGITFIGLLFNPVPVSLGVLPEWLVIMISSSSLLGHAFTANDWSGYDYDKKDPNKSNKPLIRGDITYSENRNLSLLLLAVALLSAAVISLTSLIIVAWITILNYLYSGRKVFLKSVPVVPTIIHSLGASSGFLLGYTYTGYADLNGILFSFYFGILYAAGHLNHEVMDSDSDSMSGINTNASVLGKKNALTGSFILFSLSYFYIVILTLTGILPALLIAGVMATYPVYAYFFFVTLKSSLDYKAMIWFRQKYRIIFLFWGIYMSLIIILTKQ